MSHPSSAPSSSQRGRGVLLGLVSVFLFSLTPAATRAAVRDLDPLLVGFARVAIAGVLAATYLVAAGARRPTREERPALLGVAAGVGIGFPIASALAFGTVPATHGAVVLALLPISTAATAAWRAKERPPAAFWAATAFGSLAVVAFAAKRGLGGFAAGDAWLLLAVMAGGYGYAEGGRLARTLGGPQTISWALVAVLPLALPASAVLLATRPPSHIELAAGLGLTHVAVNSQFLGFFAWYRALSEGRIATVGLIQLLQAPVGVILSALLLHEPVDPWTPVVLAAVILAIVAARERRAPRSA